MNFQERRDAWESANFRRPVRARDE